MEEIYEEYSDIVYHYLLSLTNDAEAASELTQETFYSAIKNINKFRNEASIKTWLCKIAKNKWINYYKKSKKKKLVSVDEIDETLLIEKSFEDQFVEKEQIMELYKKIHKLDESSKEVIYLRIKSELSFKDIGTIMGKSEEWARVIFYRSKIKLKEEFKNE